MHLQRLAVNTKNNKDIFCHKQRNNNKLELAPKELLMISNGYLSDKIIKGLALAESLFLYILLAYILFNNYEMRMAP